MGLREAAALLRENRLREAETECRAILQSQGRNADAHHLLGLVLHQGGHEAQAIAALRMAVELAPNNAQARINLAALIGARSPEEALDQLRMALKLRGDVPELHGNIGAALERLDRLREAEASFRNAIRLRPDYPEAHFNLGNVLRKRGQLGPARESYERSLALRPDYAKAHDGLAILENELGNATKAIEHHRKVAQLQPDHPGSRSALLYALHYSPDWSADAIAQEHREWEDCSASR